MESNSIDIWFIYWFSNYYLILIWFFFWGGLLRQRSSIIEDVIVIDRIIIIFCPARRLFFKKKLPQNIMVPYMCCPCIVESIQSCACVDLSYTQTILNCILDEFSILTCLNRENIFIGCLIQRATHIANPTYSMSLEGTVDIYIFIMYMRQWVRLIPSYHYIWSKETDSHFSLENVFREPVKKRKTQKE